MEQVVKNQLIIMLLEKLLYSPDLLTSDELQQLHFQLKTSEGESAVNDWLLEHWQSSSEQVDIDFDRIFSKVEKKIRYTEVITKAPSVRKRMLHVLKQVAAILFIPLAAWVGFLQLKGTDDAAGAKWDGFLANSSQEYSCPAGTRSKVVLPDSTQVWLNATSKLTVGGDYGKTNRRVSLVGEAFFDVAKNKELAFIVSTPEMDIKALGTSFNVSAYPDDEILETVLITGEITVNKRSGNGGKESELKMHPSQKLTLQKGKQVLLLKDDVKTERYTSWTKDKMVFEETPMDEVAKVLERWFNVKITLEDEELKANVFTGTFDNRSIDQILSYIAYTTPISYRIDKDLVFIKQKRS